MNRVYIVPIITFVMILLSACAGQSVRQARTALPGSLEALAPELSQADIRVLQKRLRDISQEDPKALGKFPSGSAYVLESTDITYNRSKMLACQTMTLSVSDKPMVTNARVCSVGGSTWSTDVNPDTITISTLAQTPVVTPEETPTAATTTPTVSAQVPTDPLDIEAVTSDPVVTDTPPEPSAYVEYTDGNTGAGVKAYAPRPKLQHNKGKGLAHQPAATFVVFTEE